MYVIVREDGKYVAPPGQQHSYTSDLEKAVVFSTREKARSFGLCGNERVIQVPLNPR